MTVSISTTPSSVPRPPWPFLLLALIAATALYISGGQYWAVPVLGVLLVGSAVVPWRLPVNLIVAWTIRVLAYSALILTSPERHQSGLLVLFEPSYLYLFGYLLLAELVLRLWVRIPGGMSRGEVLLLACLIFTAAASTDDFRYVRPIRWLVPAFMVALVLCLRAFQPGSVTARARQRSWPMVGLRMLALAAVLGGGWWTAVNLRAYGDELIRWSTRYLLDQRRRGQIGLSDSPMLRPIFNPQASTKRILRVEGMTGETHLRGLAFGDYARGSWGPPLRDRAFSAILPKQLGEASAGAQWRFVRYQNELNLLYLPLNCAAVRMEAALEADRQQGMSVRPKDELGQDWPYAATMAEPEHQGPLCLPPAAAQLDSYLKLPDEFASEARALARQVAGEGEPFKRVMAVVAHLKANHAYSLSSEPGPGDPVSSFLLEKRSGHCQYFASSAALMLRCVGVPARYVQGYYAHERAGAGAMVVRQRDAHAWAECWIDGVGWITVDATPAGGRPDQVFPQVSSLKRAGEWFIDALSAAKAWLMADGLRTAALVLSAGLLGWGLIAWAAGWWKGRRRVGRSAGCEVPDAALAELARRFERQLKRVGAPCPSHRTWHEHLSSPGAVARPVDWQAYRQFCREYNLARFGGDKRRLEQLGQILERLKQIRS